MPYYNSGTSPKVATPQITKEASPPLQDSPSLATPTTVPDPEHPLGGTGGEDATKTDAPVKDPETAHDETLPKEGEPPKVDLSNDPSWKETSGPNSEDELAVPPPPPPATSPEVPVAPEIPPVADKPAAPENEVLPEGQPPVPENKIVAVNPPILGNPKTSKLHYLIPASKGTLPFCASLVSVLVNRYAVPTMVGYKGTGEFDAKAAHIAKLRSFARYLHSPAGAEPDDLVIIQDGYDALAQLPAEFMIERYFELMAEADKRLADSYGLTVEQAHEHGLRQTLLWGADKGCWPGLYDEPQCWGNPPSSLPRNFYGPKSGNGDLAFNDPVYLNSGSVIGPLGHLRDLVDASLKLINETWSEDFKFRNSDQYYLSKLYVRQEIHRAKEINGNVFPNYGPKREIPEGYWSDNTTQTDFHIAIDYQSAFTVTQCGNENWMRKIGFNNPDHTSMYREDILKEGKTFKPFPIQMPAALFQAFVRIHNSVVNQMHVKLAGQWISSIKLGTHTRSKQIFAFYHNTCSKEHFVDKYRSYWYYPMAKRLLVAATKAIHAKEPITARLIDGRLWQAATPYPADLPDQYGGVYTDSQTGAELFVPFMDICGEHVEQIFPLEVPQL